MISIVMSHDGERKELKSIDKIDLNSKKVVWIDGENPTAEEKKDISKALGLDMDEIVDYLDREEHARVEVEDHYISIIYTVPFVEDGEKETSSFGIFSHCFTFLSMFAAVLTKPRKHVPSPMLWAMSEQL